MPLEKIYEKLGSIVSRLDAIDKNLDMHIKRSDNLEKRMKPIEYHVKFHAKVSMFFYTIITGAITAAIAGFFLV